MAASRRTRGARLMTAAAFGLGRVGRWWLGVGPLWPRFASRDALLQSTDLGLELLDLLPEGRFIFLGSFLGSTETRLPKVGLLAQLNNLLAQLKNFANNRTSCTRDRRWRRRWRWNHG